MSGYPGGGHHDQYDDGYGRQPQQGGNQQGGNTDSYYQDDQYYDQGYDNHGRNEGYYDES
jgi:1,3-beta-glucan synthase